MKMLAIGDLHGKIPKLNSLVDKEKPDVIVCTGDFADDDKIRTLIFKNWGKPWYWKIGRKKARQLLKFADTKGRSALRYLNSLGVPVYYIHGNAEDKNQYKSLKLKNLHYSHMRKVNIEGFSFIFHGGEMTPRIFLSKPDSAEKKKIEKLFKNSKKRVFVTHYTPYGLFDKIRNKQSPMNGKNIGILAYRGIIKKYKPALYICGHMHENQGISKIGKTKAVCLGMGNKNVFVIELNSKIVISKRKL